MALTRAQLISGDTSQGIVLANNPQGVKPGGIGIAISADGVISVDSLTVVGLMKLGQTSTSQAAAFNGYTWPTNDGTAKQQLTTDGNGSLSWSDADGIPWTAKGELVVGTAPLSDVLLSAGAQFSLLTSDPSTTSGLAYTDGVTTAALMPNGNTAQRPGAPVTGLLRYDTDLARFEGYWGQTPSWKPLGGPTGGATDRIFYENDQVVNNNYTLPSNQNAVTAGNVTVTTGVTVDVPLGATWTIV